jgi:hypothetical protein
MIALSIFATMGAFWFYYKLGWNVTDDVGNYIRTLAIPFWQSIEL